MTKYIIVVGGVISGTGKGIAAASVGLLMRQRGHTVQCIKFDPYLNTNAGTMNPHQHGEVWVTDDGAETDLDLGSYYRIAGLEVSSRNICTSGTLYKELIEEQEMGKYLGQTIQVIPHLTDKIQQRLLDLGEDAEIVLAEIGGTVGDIESGAFFEAIRQFKQRNWNDVMVVLVSPILWVPTIKEHKTKPLQNSVKALQSYGLQPEILLCRVDRSIPSEMLDKVSHLTNVPREAVFEAPDVPSIYQVPIEFYERHIDDLIADKFHLKRNGCKIHKYREIVQKIGNEELPELNVAIVGKYSNCDEAYISLKEALSHAGVASDARVKIRWVSAEALESSKTMRGVRTHLEGIHAMIIPGGFDSRGVEGKIRAIRFARENKIPFLGICLGLQCAVIEFARNVCGIKDADSIEFNKDTENPVVHWVPGQDIIRKKSGTMRLGAYDCQLEKHSLARQFYGKKMISERHRHRYEVNESFVDQFEAKGFKVSGKNPESGLIEVMELDQELHPYFVGTQAHPEFTSRLEKPNPLFFGLISSAKCMQHSFIQ